MAKKHVLWTEKYRPDNIEDLVLTPKVKSLLNSYITQDLIPNVIFQGPPGTGKTTAAIALCKQLGASYMIINGSMYGNIDTLRTDIKDFCSSIALNGKRKYVILDEADYLNPTSTMPALRNFIEEFSSNAGFIMTLNYPQKLIEPLHSRMAVVDFDFMKEGTTEKIKLFAGIINRTKAILKAEDVTCDSNLLEKLVVNRFKFDIRKLLNHLQTHVENGKVTAEVASTTSDYYNPLFKLVFDKKFHEARKWIGTYTVDYEIFTELNRYIEKLHDNGKLTSEQLLLITITISKYDYNHAFVMDKELNISALFAEVILAL